MLPQEYQGEPDTESYDEVVADQTTQDIDEPEQPQQADEPAESPLVLVKETTPVVADDEIIDVDQEMADGEAKIDPPPLTSGIRFPFFVYFVNILSFL